MTTFAARLRIDAAHGKGEHDVTAVPTCEGCQLALGPRERAAFGKRAMPRIHARNEVFGWPAVDELHRRQGIS